jgi:pimeloyl-ACP methyl ester carboxylesterase
MRRRLWVVVLLTAGLAAGGCSGGGASRSSDAELGLGPGETVVQFTGAGKLHLGGTVSLPANAPKGSTPAVLIVPTPGRVDRNGYLDVVPADPVYQDVSKSLAGAGLAALRYDQRGIGASKLDPGQQPSFDDMVADAREALTFLAQRKGVDPNGLAVVGHDVGGVIALRLAASDPRVKSVVLLSTPGRPLVDVVAGSFAVTDGQASADAFRAVIATLLSTGSLPPRADIRPEHQPVLPVGQDGLLRALYSLDPVNEASQVTIPALVLAGTRSNLVSGADADRLAAAMGPPAQAAVVDSTATFQSVIPAQTPSFDPNEHRAHGAGRPSDTANRDTADLDRISAFLGARLGGPRQ